MKKKSNVVVLATTLLLLLTGAESCPDTSGENPVQRRAEDRAERDGDLPGERDVMVVAWTSLEVPFFATVTRKLFSGEIREVYNRQHHDQAGYITVDFRTDDQSLSVVVDKHDASADNVMTCSLRRVNSEHNNDEQVGTNPGEVVCVWIGVVGHDTEA
jgi:hypothetical protein